MTVRKFLDLSTAHLTVATRNQLDRNSPVPIWPSDEGYGWLVWVPPSMEDLQAFSIKVPDDLAACLKLARRLGTDYILFDRDAPVRADLAVHEYVS